MPTRQRRLGLIALVAPSLVLVLGTAYAAECDKASTQADMNQCSAAEAAEADTRLNALYPRVLAGLDRDRAEALRAAQRAWIAYRDAQCRFERSAMAGGSAEGLLATGCLRGLTETRIKDLKDALGQ